MAVLLKNQGFKGSSPKEPEKKKGASYIPNREAQKEANKEVAFAGGDGDSKWFINASKFKPNESNWFRLVPWPSSVIAAVGFDCEYLLIRSYLFPHPYKRSKKDSTKAVWVSHNAECSLDPKGGDKFLALLKECWEDPDQREIVKGVFGSKYNENLKEGVSKAYQTKYWLLAIPVEEDLDDDGNSVPTADGARLISVGWSVMTDIFGGGEKKGFTESKDPGYTVFDQVEGSDICIELYKQGEQTKYRTTVRRKSSDIQDDELYLEENLPPVVELIEKGIKFEEAEHCLMVYLGLEEPKDDDEEEDEAEEEKPVEKEKPAKDFSGRPMPKKSEPEVAKPEGRERPVIKRVGR